MARKKTPLRGFAWRLYHEWVRSGLTQKEAAGRIGYERKTFMHWIYGDNVPNALALAKLCGLFQVSADYLLFGKEDKGGGQKRDCDVIEASASGDEGRERN